MATDRVYVSFDRETFALLRRCVRDADLAEPMRPDVEDLAAQLEQRARLVDDRELSQAELPLSGTPTDSFPEGR